MSIDFSLRDPLAGVLEQLSHRWSPRAFSKEMIEPQTFLNLNTETDEVLMAFAIGKIANKEVLPENLREKETPSDRKKLDQVWLAK